MVINNFCNSKKWIMFSLIVFIVILIMAVIYSLPSEKLPVVQNPVVQNFTYLDSNEDPLKYCNGVEMDSDAYRATITQEKNIDTLSATSTSIEIIKTVLDLATTGMCHEVIDKLNITENQGTVFISAIEGWAGSSITMCSCRPLVEVNLLRINGVKGVLWQ